MPEFKQHDVTDCGAACLAYVFHHHGLSTSISSIRQKAGTNRGGTTALGLVETAKTCGFESKGIRCNFDDLRSVSLPGIAHIVTDNGRLHYVVLCSIGKKTMKVMDPAVGRPHKWSVDQFRAKWTNVFILLTPGFDFVPSKGKTSAWSRLIVLLRPQKYVLTQAFVGVVLSTILSLAGAVYIQKIIDNVIVDGNRNLLHLLGLSMLVILLVRTLLGYCQSILMLKSAQRIDAGLILGYYRHLMRLPQSFFDTMRVGEITSRVRDAVAVRDFLNGTILNLVLNPLILVVALIAMFTYSWRLALYSLALIPANLVIYLASDWLNRRYQREIMERSADFDSQMVESLHAMSVVRSCSMQDEMSFRSETRLVRLLKRVWSATNAGFVIGGTGSLVTQAYSIGLLWIGAELVLGSQLTAGELMSCNALAGYITGPVVAIIGMNASIRGATTATERLYEILDLEREQDEGTSELSLEGHFDLTIDNLLFRYPGRAATLSDLSLRFASGTITALVGKSGCGKSTILALLQRHYLPESGKIYVAGVDLQYVSLPTLRAKIAYVPQRIDLLAGSVLENIAPNETQPDVARIAELCRRVGILDFIETLPRGFQTPITENGANLSGGQKQRLAIVRALYSEATIVLMDEPSSALDSESEQMLMDTLQSMRTAGKLVILAVHNRRLLSFCDRVVELDDGKVVAIRTGNSLVDRNTGPEVVLTTRPKMATEDLKPADDHPGKREELPQSPGISDVPAGRNNIVANCTDEREHSAGALVDENATDETKALFLNLRERPWGGALFGQTDANVMGIGEDGRGWFLDEGRCDIFSVTGKWPSVFGFDIGSLQNGWAATCGYMVAKIREAYSHGAAITVVWHPENPITNGDCRTGHGVADLLPGASRHKILQNRLDLIADRLGNLTDTNSCSIPILFRCWHQQNNDHFWWGRSRCTESEYLRLFRATVTYLRNVRRVRNFLYCFSAGTSGGTLQNAFERYPGDDYVDVVGLDWFGDDKPASQRQLIRLTSDVVRFAEHHNKPAALTEVGFDNGNDCRGLAHCFNHDWLQDGVIRPLKTHPVASRISLIAYWRNEAYNPSIYNLPPPGSPHARCLAELAEDPYLIFADRADGLYQRAGKPREALLSQP